MMKTFLITSMLLMTFLGITSAQQNSSDINTKLQKIIIPKVIFHEATIQESIEYLRIQSARHDDDSTIDPAKRGVNIILKTDTSSNSAKITLDLKDVSLGQALRYVTELANLKMTVQPFAVTISPITTPDSKESLAAESKDTHFKLDHITLPNVVFKEARIQDVLDYLQTQSRELDTFASESVNRGVHFILRTGDKNLPPITLNLKKYPLGGALGLVTDQAGLKYRMEGATIIIVPVVHTGLVGYADKIILPSVEFRNATLAEAITFIRIKSRELDPDKKGINILL